MLLPVFRKRITTSMAILLGFGLTILIGGLLLMLPICSRQGEMTPFLDAVFTSTSAVCVTGLVVHDTMTWWSPIGQALILILIQIGGMGIITLSALVSMAARRKIGMMQRAAIQDSIGGNQLGGIVAMTLFIVKTMLLMELGGAVLLSFRFIPRYGRWKGIGFSLFHAVSAFCNAGFDLMGEQGPFSSLTGFSSDVLVNLTVCILIILGGIGFFTWKDAAEYRFRVKRYRMQTKAVLLMSLALILLPFLFFFSLEYQDLPLAISGKTGTAQESKSKPSHALFISYAPSDDPTVAMAVRIGNGYSSTNTTLVGRDIYQYIFNLADKNQLLDGKAHTDAITSVMVD